MAEANKGCLEELALQASSCDTIAQKLNKANFEEYFTNVLQDFRRFNSQAGNPGFTFSDDSYTDSEKETLIEGYSKFVDETKPYLKTLAEKLSTEVPDGKGYLAQILRDESQNFDGNTQKIKAAIFLLTGSDWEKRIYEKSNELQRFIHAIVHNFSP
ncbi:hypothetical protein N7541_002698 [Penicillium brevicompactum]|uniref:Uncharacterized protein n=1 Tax=Penicillium brevicompactum TaxID=5074 RepID=A0A9W9UZ35_PENBR|nr:hypothetical protein N7541_002698 [Penicillium brevicompactum]